MISNCHELSEGEERMILCLCLALTDFSASLQSVLAGHEDYLGEMVGGLCISGAERIGKCTEPFRNVLA